MSAGPPFKIRVHLADGAIQSFAPTPGQENQQIWLQIKPGQLFTQPRIVIAGEYSKHVFVTDKILRVDFMHKTLEPLAFPGGYADIVDLTEAEFRHHARLDVPEKMVRRDNRTPVGDLLVSFLELRMSGGLRYYLMTEFPIKLPAENQWRMRFLLSKGSFHMRLACGGFGVINLANLAAYTVYPGVKEVPVDTWPAEPIHD